MTDQIEEIVTDHGIIHVLKDRGTGALRYDLDGWGQSSADGNGISLAAYIHAIFGLLSQAKARNVLLVGCAGGTLATMLTRARCRATIVDIDPTAFILARRYFHLPETVTCHAVDGEAFLRSGTERYDAIVLDAFRGRHIPQHLQTPGFLELVRARLTPRGAVFANIHVKHDFDDSADRLAGTMRDLWPDVRVLDALGSCDRNAIVMAGHVARLRPPDLLMRPATNARVIDQELARLSFRNWKISRWDFGR